MTLSKRQACDRPFSFLRWRVLSRPNWVSDLIGRVPAFAQADRHENPNLTIALLRATVTDDTRVESFRFSVNGTSVNSPQGDWYWAPGMQQPWGTSIQFNPGTNTFEVVCGDYWGNTASASVTFVYVPGSNLTLDIGNGGQVTPNYQAQSLELGQTYSITAQSAKGFRFDGWSGSVSSSRPKLKFVMQPYLSLIARFTDVSRPVNIIRFPRANGTVTNTTIVATGKAADNSAVTNVYYQLNDSGWETASTTNAWTNWESAALSPVSGRNVIESYAVDDSGLLSCLIVFLPVNCAPPLLPARSTENSRCPSLSSSPTPLLQRRRGRRQQGGRRRGRGRERFDSRVVLCLKTVDFYCPSIQ